MMKRIAYSVILSVLVVLVSLPHFVQGQQSGHFDWAKGWTSSLDNDLINGMVTDSDGNLYILGTFSIFSSWDGEDLLPITPYGYHFDGPNVLIAKISPNGEMLWKKVIHANNGAFPAPFGIRKVGDTAFACLVSVDLPSNSHYCYYLDTMLTTWSDYPLQLDPLSDSPYFTALITFDFEGNVLEQHFLQYSFIDTAGNDYVLHSGVSSHPDYLFLHPCQSASFDIDKKGNIYMSNTLPKLIFDSFSISEETFSGVKFWVDQRHVGTAMVNDGHHSMWVPQLLKFSPHMDTLLASRYIYQTTPRQDSLYDASWSGDVHLNPNGDIFIITNIDPAICRECIDTLYVDSLQNIKQPIGERSWYSGALIKFDSMLSPQSIAYLDDSIIVDPSVSSFYSNFFCDVAFENKLIFISLNTVRNVYDDTSNTYSVLMYQGQAIPVKSDGLILVLKDEGTIPTLQSYCIIPSDFHSRLSNHGCGNLAAVDNRIFAQCEFQGGLHFPDTTIQLEDRYHESHGLVMFDYLGNVIGGIPYGTSSPDTDVRFLSLTDSVLYLSIRLSGDNATFGEHEIGFIDYAAVIARYVDTAFMTPYVTPVVVSIDEAPTLSSVSLYPNPSMGLVTVQGLEPGSEVQLLDQSGRSLLRRTAPSERFQLDVSTLPQGIYLLRCGASTAKLVVR